MVFRARSAIRSASGRRILDMTGLLSGICAFVLAQLAIVISNRRSLIRLERLAPPTDFPLVSILVPARDEQAVIGQCLRSLLAQDYPRFELLVLDDGSTDSTPAILREMALADPRLEVLTGAQLPTDWLGKNWACAQLAERAQGELLLFTDADTHHRPGALRAAVAAMQDQQADLLAVWPKLEVGGLGEQLVVPLIPWSVFSMLSLPLAQRLRLPALSAAIGQFLLFRRTAYRAIGGHAAVRSHAAEDLTLVRRIKRAGLRWRLVDGQRLVSTRMYLGLRAAWAGLSKNLYPAFDYRGLPLVLGWGWLNLVAWAPVVTLALAALGGGAPVALPTAMAAAGGQLLLWALIADWHGFRIWLALLYPLLLAIGLALAVNSLWSTRAGRARWKGRPLSTSGGALTTRR